MDTDNKYCTTDFFFLYYLPYLSTWGMNDLDKKITFSYIGIKVNQYYNTVYNIYILL